ncbi:MAG: hypothetical protein Kow0069_28940 [Promethearchaeota archaeon]
MDADDSSAVIGADVRLEGLSRPFNATESAGSYLVDVPWTELSVGTHVLSLTATSESHASTFLNLELVVEKVRGRVSTLDGRASYSLNLSDAFALEVVVGDLDYGVNLTDCAVTYEWERGSGALVEGQEAGTYFVDLGRLPAGTWHFNVVGYKNASYNLAPLEGPFNAQGKTFSVYVRKPPARARPT